jgi:hypothetical protein
MTEQLPEVGVSYAVGPGNAEFRAHSNREALGSLARYLGAGVTEARALYLLEHPAELAAELRQRPVSVAEARRRLERRFLDPSLSP